MGLLHKGAGNKPLWWRIMKDRREYYRRRDAAIRNGTWRPSQPNRVRPPSRLATERDILWATGFLEGEGWFGIKGTTTCMRAAQENPEPLKRLLSAFGGSLRYYRDSRGRWYYDWYLGSLAAKALLKNIYGGMSRRRKKQIRQALGKTPKFGGES